MMGRYPAYKDSGVEWLGDVPEGWRWLKFRYLFRESAEKIEREIVGPMLSVSGYRGIEIKEYDDENRRRTDEDLVGYRIVRLGQLVVNTMWLNYAGLGVSDFEGHVSPAYRSYDFLGGLDRRYAHHLLRSSIYVQGYTRLLTGIRPNSLQMSRADLMDFPVLLPPLPEQKAIAAFLDRETAKIDALVAEQRRLIELLKEKRQAVISHAVTKGLAPNAPMKDSGVEWLGEVPEGWEVVPLRRLVTFNPSKSEVADRTRDEEVTFLPMEAVGDDGTLDLSRTRPIGEVETGYTYVRESDVAFAKITPCFENGKGAVMRGLTGGIAFGTTELTVLRPSDDRLKADFLYSVVASPNFLRLGEGHMYGAGGQKRVPDDFAREFPIALPPPDEQEAIVMHLKTTHQSFDALTSHAAEAIALLQQRRAALISAAVTGKIDVRDTVASTEAA